MNSDPQQGVAAAIRTRLAARQAPGIVGAATPANVLSVGNPWSAAQIELWRDTELAWLNKALVEGATTGEPDRIARIGLALADTRVRDVVLTLTVREDRAHQVAEGLWPVATNLPQPWQAPTGTVLAWCEWIDGRDPVAVLDATAPGGGYRLAEQVRMAATAGVPADVACRWATSAPLEDYRYGTDDVDVAWKAETDQAVVLGQALNRTGWALHVSAVDPTAGNLVGYLLRDHNRVAVVEAHGLALDPAGQFVAGTGAVSFAQNSSDAADWRTVVATAGATDGAAVEALLLARGLDLAYPQAAARVATSPTVLARTDQLIATGPTRGRRLT